MTDHVKARPQSAGRRDPSRRKHIEDLLDQALQDTFPASDPVAVVQPAPDVQPDDDEGNDKT